MTRRRKSSPRPWRRSPWLPHGEANGGLPHDREVASEAGVLLRTLFGGMRAKDTPIVRLSGPPTAG